MTELVGAFQAVFNFMDTVNICGMNLTTWCIIIIVLSAVALLIRGNKS